MRPVLPQHQTVLSSRIAQTAERVTMKRVKLRMGVPIPSTTGRGTSGTVKVPLPFIPEEL
jgi:hypothetical protein